MSSPDLSLQHGPVSDLFANAPAVRLSENQIASFREVGLLTGVRVLEEGQVDRLREELAGLMHADSAPVELFHEYHANESHDPDKVVFHALGAWRASPAFHDLLWNPAFVGPASQLLEGPVRFWHDQLFCKPPHQGGVVAWHQDYSYWTRTEPVGHLTCWIALDDATVENGCLMYIPGSHRWPLLPITGLTGDMESIRSVLSDEQWKAFQHPVYAELKRGECAFHHSFTVHGSGLNVSDRPRRAAVLNVFRDGTRSATGEELLQGVPPVPQGEPLTGRFFPLLTPSEQLTS